MNQAGRPDDFHPLDLGLATQAEQRSRVGLGQKPAAARFDPGLSSQGGLQANQCAKCVAAALFAFQRHAQEMLFAAQVVSEELVTFPLDVGYEKI